MTQDYNIAYEYDPITLQYTDKVACQKDPCLTGIINDGQDHYMLPANATYKKPLEPKSGYAIVFKRKYEWEYVADFRGKKYWLPTDSYKSMGTEMKELGELPEGATLTAPEQPIEDCKADKIANLKMERDKQEVSPITIGTNVFDVADKARDRLDVAFKALSDTDSVGWTMANNVTVAITKADIKTLYQALAVRSNTLHSTYRTCKERVVACVTVEEVKAVTFG